MPSGAVSQPASCVVRACPCCLSDHLHRARVEVSLRFGNVAGSMSRVGSLRVHVATFEEMAMHRIAQTSRRLSSLGLSSLLLAALAVSAFGGQPAAPPDP